MEILKVDKLCKTYGTGAVSYTHLDVYKRQDLCEVSVALL